ncbi:hypothetical protein [Undibacterium rugosum]|uniref:hypothetical protein n=1 Tax=Undibacterium rugosum TaxID=2762291 RepID=UPI001B84294C|nr:hypothetical protein [Undibacterium rugosum]MBR7780246.1 hypothetical protein [Undibacterium rugosum]
MDLEQCFKQHESQRKECVDSILSSMNVRSEMQAIQAKKGLFWQKYVMVYESPPSFHFNYLYFDGRLHFDYYADNFVALKLPQELVVDVPKTPSYISGIEQLCAVVALSLMLIVSAAIATYKRRQSKAGAKYPATPRSADS